jgi:hypothetical protein
MRHSVIKWLVPFLLAHFFSNPVSGQSNREITLQGTIEKAKNDKEKVIALQNLAHYYYSLKQEDSGDILIDQMILLAEKSQDAKLIKTALFENPAFLLTTIHTLDVARQKKKYTERALDYAKRINDAGLMALAYIQLSAFHLNNGNLEGADYFAELANTNAMASGNDTAIILSYLQQGNVSKAMSKVLIALQKYSNALDLSVEKELNGLETRVYHAMAQFYKELDKMSKSRELLFKSIALNQKLNNAKGLMDDYMMMAKMCESDHSSCERIYLQNARHLADSLNEIEVQMECKRLNFYSLFDKYTSDSMFRALEADKDLKTYFRNFGPGNLDWVYGQIFLYDVNKGKEDSAVYYFNRAEDSLYKTLVMSRKKNFILELAIANSKHNIPAAIINYKNLLNLHEKTLSWSGMAESSAELMKLYEFSGDYRKAYEYNKLFDEYNTKYAEQSRKNDVDLLTLENDRKEKARELELALEAQKRSYNLQYLFIAVIIISLFTVLAMMGLYKVSRKTIRMVGFFTFLLLFEFIILLSKKWMTQFTHGTPWQDLLFMLMLAFFMLPLHHWLEHQVIDYLTTRDLLKGHKNEVTRHPVHIEKKSPSIRVKERDLQQKKKV